MKTKPQFKKQRPHIAVSPEIYWKIEEYRIKLRLKRMDQVIEKLIEGYL